MWLVATATKLRRRKARPPRKGDCFLREAQDSRCHVRKLIRNKRTGKFLTNSGEWTDSIIEAGNFSSKMSVSNAREGFRLPVQECDLYYSFNESCSDQSDFSFPLHHWHHSVNPQLAGGVSLPPKRRLKPEGVKGTRPQDHASMAQLSLPFS